MGSENDAGGVGDPMSPPPRKPMTRATHGSPVHPVERAQLPKTGATLPVGAASTRAPEQDAGGFADPMRISPMPALSDATDTAVIQNASISTGEGPSKTRTVPVVANRGDEADVALNSEVSASVLPSTASTPAAVASALPTGTTQVLLRALIQAYVAGETQSVMEFLADSLQEDLAGHIGRITAKVISKVAAKAGEGVVNGILVRRLGMAALQLLQPTC